MKEAVERFWNVVHILKPFGFENRKLKMGSAARASGARRAARPARARARVPAWRFVCFCTASLKSASVFPNSFKRIFKVRDEPRSFQNPFSC